MMNARPRRIVFPLVAVLCVGCGLISGASDLEVVTDGASTSPPRDDATTDALPTADGGTKETGGDASVDAPLPKSRLREVTFESGQVELPGGDGVDDLDGEGLVQTTVVLNGNRSLALESGRVTVEWPEQDEVWLRWVLLRDGVVAGPLAQFGPLTLDMISAGADRAQVRVRIGSTVAATSPSLRVGNVPLHLGLHFKKGVTNGVIEVWANASQGKNGQLGMPFLSQTTASVTFDLTEVVIGSPAAKDRAEMILDDILVDNASMPP